MPLVPGQPSSVLVGHADGRPRRRPPCRFCLVLILVMSLLPAVLPVAGAELTDVVSLAAIYAAAADDDLLKLLTDPGMPQKGAARWAVDPVPIPIRRPPCLAASSRSNTSLLAFRLRSPPPPEATRQNARLTA